jgi:hypothetical protein
MSSDYFIEGLVYGMGGQSYVDTYITEEVGLQLYSVRLSSKITFIIIYSCPKISIATQLGKQHRFTFHSVQTRHRGVQHTVTT